MQKILTDEKDTIKLAEMSADLIKKGDVIFLYGELGAGKTFYTRHLCRYLGVTEPVSSPSYVLLNQYHAPDYIVNHLDLYRLGDADEVFALGITEFLENNVTIIEWPLLAEELLPFPALKISFSYDGETRAVEIEGKYSKELEKIWH
ncbi:MAG: tRNA (adenosine(37)-N6)-threonylcarbamoyltransferase complex ATPase subunit type 1 TsaE [Candidatus Cloacimonetes bacterium]|nr:tRNA (adenosine(37)-N6)-threonylcarbamoyltransferase complex ATPase subunit type 1 TsaE [Candidatus Cloacimonadota bacterium]